MPGRSPSPYAAFALANCTFAARTVPLDDPAGYRDEELRQRGLDPTLATCPLLFLEIDGAAPAGSGRHVHVRGIDSDGYSVLRISSRDRAAMALAAVALRIRDTTGARPHLYLTSRCRRATG